jgi:uncharacterized protein YecE (DUF72 family)
MRRAVRFRVGCSGWQYRHWKGNFYPADLPQREWLEHYARHFDTVEVNNSFYRLPEEGIFGAWRARVPAGFLFAVKASRFLTHMKKLKDPEEPLMRLFSRARELGAKLGPVLYQLPKQMPRNDERLSSFLDVLPRRTKHAIEFRHRVGTHRKCCGCCRGGMSRCASTTCPTQPPPAWSPRDSCMCDFTARPGVTTAHILMRSSMNGPSG